MGDRDNKYYIPVMHIQITEDNKIPSTYEEIEKCEYIIDEYNPKKEKYRYSTIISDNITSRVQKLYKYIGNFPVTGLLEDEYIDNGIPLWLHGTILEITKLKTILNWELTKIRK